MKKKTMLERSLFTRRLSVPENRNSILCVNIHDNNKFNMNGRLSSKLGGKTLEILFTDDRKNFLIVENGNFEEPITFPKSGSKTIPGLAENLKRHKIILPAKYEVWQRDGGSWQGDYLENPTIPPSQKRQNLKQR